MRASHHHLPARAVGRGRSAPPRRCVARRRSPAPSPQITRVTPMRISVGKLLTIRGRPSRRKAEGNTVIFRAGNGRTAFAKPRRASRTKLVVRVPAAVARLLTVKNSKQRPTRLKLRVLAGKFSTYTSRRLSPVVTGVGGGDGGGDGGATVCNDDSDHDNDLLPNSLELQIGTDPCLADTDDDGMSDGWEYYVGQGPQHQGGAVPRQAAVPERARPLGRQRRLRPARRLRRRRPHHRARSTAPGVIRGSSFIASQVGGTDLESPLGYSDGTKSSRPDEAPGVPTWRSAELRPAEPGEPFPGPTTSTATRAWHDDERDADGDGLATARVRRGPRHRRLVARLLGRTASASRRRSSPEHEVLLRHAELRHFAERPFAELDLADPDVDGDGLLDGEDDQDNDD